MANPIMRPAPIYYKGKKVAMVKEGSYDIDSNDQREIASEGFLGHTDGAVTTTMQMTLIVPVPGMDVAMLPDMLAKQNVKVGIFTDGHYHSMEGRIVKMSYTWNHERGEMRCTGTFEGGAPELA